MRRSNLFRGLAVAAAAALLSASGSPAASLFRVPLGRASRAAKSVVVGTVLSTSARLAVAPSGQPRIFTDVRLGDLAVAAGDSPGRTVLLSVIGGTLGGRTLMVAGAPVFEPGRRYVLFLAPGEPFTGLAGWTQGQFRVERDPAGVDRVHDASGAPVEAVEDGRVRTGGGGAAMPLSSFLDAVRALRAETPPPGERLPGRGPRARRAAPTAGDPGSPQPGPRKEEGR